MTQLPEVSPTIFSACRMGTPAPIMFAKLRLNRATAIFFSSGPKTGSFSRTGSTTLRTCSVFLFLRHQTLKPMITTARTGTT